jgi:hypothetical protein
VSVPVPVPVPIHQVNREAADPWRLPHLLVTHRKVMMSVNDLPDPDLQDRVLCKGDPARSRKTLIRLPFPEENPDRR